MTDISKIRPGQSLSPRESEVLQLLVDGCTNSQIAYLLGISIKTVEQRVASLFIKMEVNNRVSLAVKAMRTGMVS